VRLFANWAEERAFRHSRSYDHFCPTRTGQQWRVVHIIFRYSHVARARVLSCRTWEKNIRLSFYGSYVNCRFSINSSSKFIWNFSWCPAQKRYSECRQEIKNKWRINRTETKILWHNGRTWNCVVREPPQKRPLLDNGLLACRNQCVAAKFTQISAATDGHEIIKELFGDGDLCISFVPKL
jgi:hypothetical protein